MSSQYLRKRIPCPISCPVCAPRSVHIQLFNFVHRRRRRISSLAIRPIEGRSKPREICYHVLQLWESEAERTSIARSTVREYIQRTPCRSLWGLSSVNSTFPNVATDEKVKKSSQQSSPSLPSKESSRPSWGLSGTNSMTPLKDPARKAENMPLRPSLSQLDEKSFSDILNKPGKSTIPIAASDKKFERSSHNSSQNLSGPKSASSIGFTVRKTGDDLSGGYSAGISNTSTGFTNRRTGKDLSEGSSARISNTSTGFTIRRTREDSSEGFSARISNTPKNIRENLPINSSRRSWGYSSANSSMPPTARFREEDNSSFRSRSLPAQNSSKKIATAPPNIHKNPPRSSWGLSRESPNTSAPNLSEKKPSQLSWGLPVNNSLTRVSSSPENTHENITSKSPQPSHDQTSRISALSATNKNDRVESTPSQSSWGLGAEKPPTQISSSNVDYENSTSNSFKPMWGLSGVLSTIPPALENNEEKNRPSRSAWGIPNKKTKLIDEEMTNPFSSHLEKFEIKPQQEELQTLEKSSLPPHENLEKKHSSSNQEYPLVEPSEPPENNELNEINSSKPNNNHNQESNNESEFSWIQLRKRADKSNSQPDSFKQGNFETQRDKGEEDAKFQSYIPLSSTYKSREIKPTENYPSDINLDRNNISHTLHSFNDTRSSQNPDDGNAAKHKMLGLFDIGIISDPEIYVETPESQISQSGVDQSLDLNQSQLNDKEWQKDFDSSPLTNDSIETKTAELEQVEELVSKPKKQKKKRGVENKPIYDDVKSSKKTGKDKERARREAQFIRNEEEKLEAEILLEKKLERQRIKAEKKAARKAAPTPILLPQYIKIANLAVALKIRYEELATKMKELGYEETQSDLILNSEDSALIASEYKFEPIIDRGEDEDLKARDPHPNPSELPSRPPIVTIMGHVDHGKTTLLDFLRKSSVAAGEHGGITQHIGAFSVAMPGGKKATFLDTPGHAAFLSMRQRGANVTDIVVLVVAADDSVKPQTLEAINHARVANVPMIVAINKIDKPEIDIEQVKLDLARHGVEIEDFGGDTQVVCVSGKTGKGMDELEENIIALADILDLHAESTCTAEGWVLEASKKAVGKVATVLIRRGTLHPGDIIVAGTTWAKVRVLRNEVGDELQEAGPGTPVEVDGWREQPLAGDEVLQAEDEIQAKRVTDYRIEKYERSKLAIDIESINAARNESRQLKTIVKAARDLAVEDKKAGKGWKFVVPKQDDKAEGPKSVYFIVRADVSGSVEAVLDQVKILGTKEVEPVILRSSVGQVSEFDIEYAAAAKGHIINFNTRIESHIRRLAEESKVKIIENSIIYALIDGVKAELSTHLPPIITQRVLGEAMIAQIFMITVERRKQEPVAGCKVSNGTMKRNGKVRVMREGEKVFEGEFASLRVRRDNATEVNHGNDCGLSFQGWQDFKVGDLIQHYEEIHEKRYF